jgi:hypothetical protein
MEIRLSLTSLAHDHPGGEPPRHPDRCERSAGSTEHARKRIHEDGPGGSWGGALAAKLNEEQGAVSDPQRRTNVRKSTLQLQSQLPHPEGCGLPLRKKSGGVRVADSSC